MLSSLVMFNLVMAERQPVVAVQVSRQITSGEIDARRVILPDMSAKPAKRPTRLPQWCQISCQYPYIDRQSLKGMPCTAPGIESRPHNLASHSSRLKKNPYVGTRRYLDQTDMIV